MATDLLDSTTRLVGITGGIGCGKSVVSRICRLRGFDVYDCDSEAKMLMDNDPLLKSTVVEILGRDILLSDGSLDRKIIATLIFSDDCKRRKINTAVHSAVKADISEWVSINRGKLLFVESAILATSGFADSMDSIWRVVAPENICIDRVMKRNEATREDVVSRIDSQRTEFDSLPAEKCQIIDNCNGAMPLLVRISELIDFERKVL